VCLWVVVYFSVKAVYATAFFSGSFIKLVSTRSYSTWADQIQNKSGASILQKSSVFSWKSKWILFILKLLVATSYTVLLESLRHVYRDIVWCRMPKNWPRRESNAVTQNDNAKARSCYSLGMWKKQSDDRIGPNCPLGMCVCSVLLSTCGGCALCELIRNVCQGAFHY